MVEGLRLREIANVEVDVAHHCSRRHAHPALTGACVEDALHVECLGRDLELPIAAHTPRRARSIGIDLDAETIGIGEIDRLADGMIRHPDDRRVAEGMPDEPPERRSIRKQNREVVEPERASARHRVSAWALVELDKHALGPMGTERCTVRRLRHRLESQAVLVGRQRARKIGDLEVDASYPCRRRQPEAGGRNAVRRGGRRRLTARRQCCHRSQ